MKAACSSETLESTSKSTRRYKPEDQHRLHRRENLKSHIDNKTYSIVTDYNICSETLYLSKHVEMCECESLPLTSRQHFRTFLSDVFLDLRGTSYGPFSIGTQFCLQLRTLKQGTHTGT
jgi:hypothetical protein